MSGTPCNTTATPTLLKMEEDILEAAMSLRETKFYHPQTNKQKNKREKENIEPDLEAKLSDYVSLKLLY